MKRFFSILISFILFVLLTYFSYQTYSSAKELNRINRAYYEAQTDISDIIKRKFSSILSTISLGSIDNKENLENRLQELKAKRVILKDRAKKDILKVSAVALILLLLYFILDLVTYSLLLGLSSLITLSFGVVTPILMIVIHKYIQYLGDIVLSFESKTIFDTIKHLYNSHNYPVAITILLFSIIVPFFKTITMIIISITKEFHISKRVLNIFKHLGKWSMLDVFVVSLLLVYLSMGSSQNSYSEIENGLYLFLIYVILSIFTSLSTERLLSAK